METKPKEPPRRACTLCREKKVKCLESQVDPAICKRCCRMGTECVVPHAPRQRRRKRLDRVEQLEKNLDMIAATLAGHSLPGQIQEGSLPVQLASPYTRSLPTPRSDAIAVRSGQADVFDQGLLRVEYGEVLLNQFRDTAKHFPYVVISETVLLLQLRRESPMLLLAILVVSSWRDRSLQTKLEQEYLGALSSRLLIQGEQSLDILQALLVYNAWCHFHLKSVYRFISLAVTLVVELGLNMRPRECAKQKIDLRFSFHRSGSIASNGPNFWNQDARRAFLGCYLLSTSFSLVIRKVNPLKFTSYLEECALSLARENQVPTDSILIHQIRLVHHAEEISDTLGYFEFDENQQMTDEKLRIRVKALEQQLEDWRINMRTSLGSNSPLNMSYHIVNAYIHEVGLYDTNRSLPLATRITVLFDCLVDVKKHLDTVIALSHEHLQRLLGMDWAKTHYAIILVSKITFDIEWPLWTVESVRQIIKLESYLELLCLRLKEQNELISSAKDESNWYHFLLIQWESVKRRYLMDLSKLVTRPIEESSEQSMRNQPVIIPDPSSFQVNDAVSTGFDAIDFMANDWFWLPSDPSIWQGSTF